MAISQVSSYPSHPRRTNLDVTLAYTHTFSAGTPRLHISHEPASL